MGFWLGGSQNAESQSLLLLTSLSEDEDRMATLRLAT